MCQINEYGYVIENKTYLLPAITPAGVTLDIKIWHRRFGHLGWRNLRLTKTMVKCLDFEEWEEPKDPCDPCELGQPIWSISREPQVRETEIFILMHIDVFKITPIGINGHT